MKKHWYRYNLPDRLILAENESREHLRPYEDLLLTCLFDAWKSWEEFGKKLPKIRKAMRATARAIFLSDQVKENVRAKFTDKFSGIAIRQKGSLFALDIKGVILMRFKKFNKKLQTSNVPTRQQMNLQMQVSVKLADFPDEATWLTCGYVLNEHETEIQNCYITCAIGRDIKYKIELSAENIGKMESLPVERTTRKAKVSPQRKSVTKQAQAINE